jgi:hypothetical protein
MAAAMSICAAAPVSAEAGPPSGVVLRAGALPSVDVGAEAAATIDALPAVPSTGLAVSAEFPAPTPRRAGGVAAPAAPCVGVIAAGGIAGPAAASGSLPVPFGAEPSAAGAAVPSVVMMADGKALPTG